MDAVLTCMVDEKIGPGELNALLVQQVREAFGCCGAVALRSPETALKYIFRALDFPSGGAVMISALAPAWHVQAVEELGCRAVVLDVDEATGLVTPEIVRGGISAGGRLLLLHESHGIMPDMDGIMRLEIPVIEDISRSAGAAVRSEEEDGSEVVRAAGSFGLYAILGMEERDVITAGGGAVLMTAGRREWTVLRKYTDLISGTELLPDINCALGWVQLKEFGRNEAVRKDIFSLYQRACLSGRHRPLAREPDGGSTMSSFPLVLDSPFRDVRQYAAKKDVEVRPAYEDSVMALREEELSSSCIHAKSLYLRSALFPLYPRLTHSQAAKVVKILGTLP